MRMQNDLWMQHTLRAGVHGWRLMLTMCGKARYLL
jgi:hypothetical protein